MTHRKHAPKNSGRGVKSKETLPDHLRHGPGVLMECPRCRVTYTGSAKQVSVKCRLTPGCKGRLRIKKVTE